uniref:Uncharacterized protein TCIL3000_4_3520 n=1 Tax=Trypanosoma congolense (strain IL3000) TaxID=1068625 RepID=G0ULJ5_TRYCI|nr:unnamed protein product [Trypanosoma congolense IL3000]
MGCEELEPQRRDSTASQEDDIRGFLAPLESGEEFARRILNRMWYRELTKLSWKEELERQGVYIILRSRGIIVDTGKEQQEEDEEDKAEEITPGSSQMIMMHEQRLRRERNEFLYGEETVRTELLHEAQNAVSIIALLMEESLDRVAMMESAFAVFELIVEVLKPRPRRRYVFSWGVFMDSVFKPLRIDVDRIRNSQRHIPPHLRREHLTCRVPLEPIYYKPDGGKELLAIRDIETTTAVSLT